MFELILLSLTVWRISSLVKDESGPFDIFETFREWVYSKDNRLFVGIIECFWCLSIWIAFLVSMLGIVFNIVNWNELFFYTFATSAIAIFIDTKIFGD